VTDRGQFTIEPWGLHEAELDLDRLAHTETVFALANGHFGLRGNLDEGEPFEVTLEDRVLGAWEALTAGRFAECPVCHDPLGFAGCETCGSELS